MKGLFSEGGESERSSDGLSNSEVLMDVTLGADLLGLPSGLVDSEGSTIAEVREVGKVDALNIGGMGLALQSKVVSHFVVLLRSGVVWYGYNIPHNS